MPGLYEMSFWQEEGITGAFCDYFSIDGETDGEEKAAAIQVLVYLLADRAQDVMYVQNGSFLPLNRKAYDAYVEINREFEGLAASLDKAVMAGEHQALLDRWFRDILKDKADRDRGE